MTFICTFLRNFHSLVQTEIQHFLSFLSDYYSFPYLNLSVLEIFWKRFSGTSDLKEDGCQSNLYVMLKHLLLF